MMRIIASACVLLAAGLAFPRVTFESNAIALPTAAPVKLIESNDAPLPLLVSYRVLMTGLTGWAAYGLFELNARDEVLTDSDWSAASISGLNLTAIATLLSIQGSGQNDKRRHDDPEWRGMVTDLQNASALVAAAAFKRDRGALGKSLIMLGDACQACHERFMKPLSPAGWDMAR